ncbi:MAG: protein kinase [Candidatus Melainabacteria bacterium]|nr:protein kinase [Candidatus Melainabacteria bacterium]
MEKRKAGVGSITQWISICQCDELKFDPQDDSLGEHILLCTECNKRIGSGRVGSLTQWIFRSDLCACETPSPIATRKPIATPNPKSIQDTTQAFEDGEFVGLGPADQTISVDEDSFPLDRYRALAEIGRGASGIVYRAVDKVLQKEIAIKCLKTVTANELMSFQKEAQATSRLNHPNIIKIFDFGAARGGAPYMVMEFLQGISLKRLIDANGPLPENEALLLFLDLVQALVHAHSKGIYHRDIKSSNVIIIDGVEDPKRQTVRLIDFGVASSKGVESPLGNKTVLVGTPPYMAPEQLEGKPFDARSEVYSLGCLFYEALTGNPPFLGETALETLNMHRNLPVIPLLQVQPELEFSEEIESLILHCLAKQPDQRIQSMEELESELESIIVHSPAIEVVKPRIFDPAIDTIDSAPIPPIRSRLKSAILFCGIGALCVGVGAVLLNRLSPFSHHQEAPVKLMRESKVLVPQQTVEWTNELVDREDFFFRGDRAAVTSGSDKSLDQLVSRPGIKHLRLIRCKISEKGARKLLGLKLESLHLDNTFLDTGGLTLVGKMNTIRDLQITNTKWFTGHALRMFQNIPLTALTIEACDLQDDSLVFLKNQKSLAKLIIARNPSFTGAGIAHLSGCPNLIQLSLFELRKLKDECFAEAAKLPALQIFLLKDSFYMAGRTRDDLTAALGGATVKPYDFQFFQQLTSKKTITNLALDGDRLESKHFEAISKMPSLTTLTIVRHKFMNPDDIRKLSKMPSLSVLRFMGPCLEGSAIKQICAMQNIKRLALLDCELSDSAFAEFPKSIISHLVIEGDNKISGVGLDFIAKMPRLLLLRLPEESYITPLDIKRFQSKRPIIKLDHKKGTI